MLRNPNDDMQDKLNKFWTSLSAWMDQQEVIEKYFRVSIRSMTMDGTEELFT